MLEILHDARYLIPSILWYCNAVYYGHAGFGVSTVILLIETVLIIVLVIVIVIVIVLVRILCVIVIVQSLVSHQIVCCFCRCASRC